MEASHTNTAVYSSPGCRAKAIKALFNCWPVRIVLEEQKGQCRPGLVLKNIGPYAFSKFTQ